VAPGAASADSTAPGDRTGTDPIYRFFFDELRKQAGGMTRLLTTARSATPRGATARSLSAKVTSPGAPRMGATLSTLPHSAPRTAGQALGMHALPAQPQLGGIQLTPPPVTA